MRSRFYLIALGLLSLILYLVLTDLSKEFTWGKGHSKRPILEYLFIYFALFVFYALACLYVFKSIETQKTFLTLVAFGLLFRCAILPSQQIQEDDVYRYLWDGKVFAHGINPFKFSPQEINEYKFLKIQEPIYFNSLYEEHEQNELSILNDLKWESDRTLQFMERINHPDVPTIYPPLAQYVFRLSQQINQDSLITLRILFLAFDLMGMVFIVLTLKALNMNKNFSLVYFWSPLVIKETFNSTHLDIIGISCLCMSIYFLVRRHMMGSFFFLALSVLGKLYSGILLPFYLQRCWFLVRENGSRSVIVPFLYLIFFFIIIITCYLPFIDIGEKVFDGLKTYGMYWQSNDSLFAILLYFIGGFMELAAGLGIPTVGSSMLLTKISMASVVLGAVIYMLVIQAPNTNSPEKWVRNIFIVMALVFLISPVQNPWYLCWTVPFLCLFHSRSLILLTGLVGLYYLDFYFDYHEITHYSAWIAWFEYTPFYVYLALELTMFRNTCRIKKRVPGSD